MSLITAPRIVKWPFFMGDALLICLAWFFYRHADLPFNGPTLTACVACLAIGAALATLPFLLDYRALLRIAESDALTSVVAQIKGLETVASAVTSATGNWQHVHDRATETVNAARQISDKMSEEMKSFMEFFEKARQSEKQHLALEVDKLKRAESDWLAVLVRILDHVYAINSAARRAGKPEVSNQLMQFQLACRDAARRVGLVPIEDEPGAPFDKERHQLSEGAEAPEESRIGEVLATGYRFRGQMVRSSLVTLEGAPAPDTETSSAPPHEPPGGDPSEQELSL